MKTYTMSTISTKFLPATNSRGDRIKAFCNNDCNITVTIGYRYQDEDGGHAECLRQLAEKLGWGPMMIGSTETGIVGVMINSPIIG